MLHALYKHHRAVFLPYVGQRTCLASTHCHDLCHTHTATFWYTVPSCSMNSSGMPRAHCWSRTKIYSSCLAGYMMFSAALFHEQSWFWSKFQWKTKVLILCQSHRKPSLGMGSPCAMDMPSFNCLTVTMAARSLPTWRCSRSWVHKTSGKPLNNIVWII